MSEEEDGNPTAISEGSPMDTDEGKMMISQQSVCTFLELIIKSLNLAMIFYSYQNIIFVTA